MEVERSSDTYSNTYWGTVLASWKRNSSDRLWREFTDRQQSGWAKTYLLEPNKGVKLARLLKTDLFDEAVSTGIVPMLAQVASEVWGVDVSEEVVSEAAVRYPSLRGRVASVAKLPFEDGYFQAIFSGSTLDHFDSKVEILDSLRELHRVLGRNGRLFITMDNPHNPMIWLRNGLLRTVGTSLRWIPYHMGKTMLCREFVSGLRDAGFQIDAVTALQHCPRWWVVRRLKRLEGYGAAITARYLDRLGWYERLERLPSRYITGHYLAVLATKF
jgi:SAM-dependent methyltransferase